MFVYLNFGIFLLLTKKLWMVIPDLARSMEELL